MNEKAIQDAYALFRNSGYKKSIDEFKTLLSTNENALKDAYTLFEGAGYKKDINQFKTLMGAEGSTRQQTKVETVEQQQPVKKKEPTVSASKLGQPTSASSSKKDDIPNVANVDFTNKSGNKPASNIYTGYPGKGGKRYKFENGAWFEELYTSPTTTQSNIKSGCYRKSCKSG
jgi:hypothetical protein